MATFYQTDAPSTSYGTDEYSDVILHQCGKAISQFKSVIRSYLLFHFAFAIFFLLQFFVFSYLLTHAPSSLSLAISLAVFLLSIFSYVILIQYFQGKKLGQFSEIQKQFFSHLKRKMPENTSLLDYHLNIANAAFQLTTYLHQKETYILSLPPFRFSEKLMIKIGFLFNWRDMQRMQEMLMNVAIKEHVRLIKMEPTNLAVHTSLANAFIALSKVYRIPQEDLFSESYLMNKIFSNDLMRKRFSLATNRAIEELKVLDDLAPNDPWIHAQLATCYHHLEMVNEEIREYETLLQLRPNDKAILFRLGVLYFEVGKMANGLRIYEKLSTLDAKEAEELISHYDGFMEKEFHYSQFSPI